MIHAAVQVADLLLLSFEVRHVFINEIPKRSADCQITVDPSHRYCATSLQRNNQRGHTSTYTRGELTFSMRLCSSRLYGLWSALISITLPPRTCTPSDNMKVIVTG